MAEEFKLKVELVPKTSWYNNVRGEIPRRVWDKIRTNICISQKHTCGICWAEGKLNCHEIWEYDDINHIQELKDFIALCNLCHHVKHIGYASILASQGKLNMQEVEDHFMRINNCDLQTFRKQVVEAMIQYNERSKHEWQLSLGKYEEQIRGTEEQKNQKIEILNELSELESLQIQIENMQTQIHALELEEQNKISQILTPEITARVEEIRTNYSEKTQNTVKRIKTIKEQVSTLENKIKNQVLQYGRAVKGSRLQFVWNKGAKYWDTKSIEDYSVSHPEILQFCKERKPYVSIRPIQQSKDNTDD